MFDCYSSCTLLTTSQFLVRPCLFFFFFNDTATTEIYTLSLHDALPISEPTHASRLGESETLLRLCIRWQRQLQGQVDRKSTRLNSSHSQISYAVFCLKKKTTTRVCTRRTRC